MASHDDHNSVAERQDVFTSGKIELGAMMWNHYDAEGWSKGPKQFADHMEWFITALGSSLCIFGHWTSGAVAGFLLSLLRLYLVIGDHRCARVETRKDCQCHTTNIVPDNMAVAAQPAIPEAPPSPSEIRIRFGSSQNLVNLAVPWPPTPPNMPVTYPRGLLLANRGRSAH